MTGCVEYNDSLTSSNREVIRRERLERKGSGKAAMERFVPAEGVVEKVRLKWRSESVVLRPPAPSEALHAFERDHAISLPTSLRSLLLLADGYEPDCKDEDGFRFLSMAEYTPPRRHVLATDLPDTCIVVVDYLDWSWGYAVECGDNRHGAVFMIGTANGRPWPVASSFEEFLELYLRDDSRLYGSNMESS